MTIKLKKWYLDLIEKDSKNILEVVFYCFLLILSLIYGAAVKIRNFLYDRKILKSFSPSSKIISIGNLSWAGTGKTTLAIYLYEKLSKQFKTALLRRGYGKDEEKLLKEKINSVFSSPNRVKLAKKLSSKFELFILDDGFQHRKLNRDLNIVIISGRDLRRKIKLIPASYFREPLNSLRRAQILILSYKEEISRPQEIKNQLLTKFPRLKIYFSSYKFKQLSDLNRTPVNLDTIKDKKIAGLCAIGYPQGFFNKLRQLNLNIAEEITYPDHYELSIAEFKQTQDKLLEKGINTLIITAKDKYHLPNCEKKINIYIMEIDIEIDGDFLEEVVNKITK